MTTGAGARTPNLLGFPMALPVLATYGIVILGAGHGALPAGLLLVFGLTKISGMNGELLQTLVAGWLGVALLAPTLIPAIARRTQLLPTVGVVCLLLSVIGLASYSEVMPITLATAVPFLVVSSLTLVRIWKRPAPAPRQDGDSGR